MALQIALEVARGGRIMGQQVEPGKVLYLALEDPPRRLKERMQMQGWTTDLGVDFMPMGEFEKQLGFLQDGGGKKLAGCIKANGYQLVVIDTLSKSLRGDQNDVAVMTAALRPLFEMAHEKNCTILLIDHHNKVLKTGLNPVDDILGSTAKGAGADGAWGLYKERGKLGAKLAVTGREIAEQTLALVYANGRWIYEGDADELELTKNREALIQAVKELGQAGGTALAKAVGRDKGNVYRDLQDLVNANILTKEGAMYQIATGHINLDF